MLEMPQQRAPSPLGIVLSGWKTSGTHGELLFKPQIDSSLMAQRQNRKKEGISLFLTFCLTPSVSHRLQETDYISNKGCENERMGSWEEDVTAETRPAQSLFPLNAPEIFKQDKALIAERKKGNLRKSAVMRKDKRESIRHGEILKIQKEQKHNIIFFSPHVVPNLYSLSSVELSWETEERKSYR